MAIPAVDMSARRLAIQASRVPRTAAKTSCGTQVAPLLAWTDPMTEPANTVGQVGQAAPGGTGAATRRHARLAPPLVRRTRRAPATAWPASTA